MRLALLIPCFFLAVATACSQQPVPPAQQPAREPVAVLSKWQANDDIELTPQARLRKLSFHLRGLAPSNGDYEALDVVSKSQLEEFFEKKTREYLNTPEYTGKMIDRLDELFRLKSSAGRPEARLIAGSTVPNLALPGGETLNAMDLLFEDMARKNLSWDSLLLSHEYRIPNNNSSTTSEVQFLEPMAPGLPALAADPKPRFLPISFDAEDPRIAGAITTARFFNRYSTTNLNRSRGRAAAIFRTFLCDDMRAVVTPKADDDDDLLKKAFPKPKPVDGWHTAEAISNGDKHGTDVSCIACHYKLDPLGRSFYGIGSVLSDEASPGSLVYRRPNGDLVSIKGRGIGDLAKSLTQQPEYVSCQVSHFWRWFIRADEMPSTARLAELSAEFNRLGRRAGDFTTYLVNQKEFYTSAGDPSHVGLLQVRSLLDRCTSCHSGLAMPMPGFTTLPIGGSASEHEHWLRRIVARLDLHHEGLHHTMPPVQSAWQSSPEELLLVKQWVGDGARDEYGTNTISSKLAAELISPDRPEAPGGATSPQVTFKDTYRRYLAGHDFFRLMEREFSKSRT